MRLPTILLALAALLLAGCESFSSDLKERFSAVPPKVQTFKGTPEAVASAAVIALKRIEFRVLRAKGLDIEGASQIHTSTAFADSRQQTVKIHLSEVGPGQTDVSVTLTEEVQSESVGGTSKQGLRESGFFDLYFATLQQVLDEDAAHAASLKN